MKLFLWARLQRFYHTLRHLHRGTTYWFVGSWFADSIACECGRVFGENDNGRIVRERLQ